MADRDQADALARELVASGWRGWREGMVALPSKRLKGGTVIDVGTTTLTIALDEPRTWLDRLHRVRTSKLDDVAPDLGHYVTAAVLAVQAMERGGRLNYAPREVTPFWRATTLGADGRWFTHHADTLGEVAARALLALSEVSDG